MKRTHKRAYTVGIALAAAAAALLLSGTGLMQRLEWITVDQRMRHARAEATLHPDIAVVLIDEASLKAMDPLVGRYPWPRAVYADLIEFLAMGGARAIVFDVLYSEQDPTGGDARFGEATGLAGNVFHAMQLYPDDQLETPAALPVDFAERFGLPAGGDPASANNEYALPLPVLYRGAAGVGTVGMDADADGIYRRVPLFQRYDGRLYPALSVAPLLTGPDESVEYGSQELRLGTRTIPLDGNSRYLVNVAGDIEAYSVGGLFATMDAIRTGRYEDLAISPDEFSEKVVFIGASATGLEDLKPTALSARTPGVYLHASAASNLLANDFLRSAHPAITGLAALLLASVAVTAVLKLPLLALQVLLPLSAAGGYIALTYGRFGVGQVMNLTAPLLAMALALMMALSFHAFTEGRDRRRVRRMLAQYVSPDMLSEALDNVEDQLRAEVGSREHLTILFSDVRGFTSLSEQLSAERVVELLNVHFSYMTEIIFHGRGTLDKFIGDAMMAFWGAPIRVPDHALRAVRAAIEMDRGTVEVNATLAERGYPPIAIGLGVNTGDVVLGNIGSERKLDYTVIGDPVNLASRLEGLCKTYGCPIVISESTFRELGGVIPCATLDLVRVKGKSHPIRIYWPLALPEDPPATLAAAWDMAQLTATAFEHYLKREFATAREMYARLPDNRLRVLFQQRIAEFEQAPPPPGWDGVFTLTTK